MSTVSPAFGNPSRRHSVIRLRTNLCIWFDSPSACRTLNCGLLLNEHSTAAGADELSTVVRNVDLPNVQRSSGVNGRCFDCDNSLTYGVKMIGIDLDADR